jgi:hypothetical protein
LFLPIVTGTLNPLQVTTRKTEFQAAKLVNL